MRKAKLQKELAKYQVNSSLVEENKDEEMN